MKQKEEEIQQKAEYCLQCKTKPCQTGCPLENDIPGMIQKIRNQDIKGAYEVLCQTTMLPAICGTICPHKSQCEGSCVRGKRQEPVSIGMLEEFIGKQAIKQQWEIPLLDSHQQKEKIAILGGGPCGLTCAGFLARMGYAVTIFERSDILGGILVHGIPDFRLDRKVVQKQIEKILKLGITVQYQKELGENLLWKDLEKQYNAVFVSIGANVSSKMQIPGEDLKGVYGANELLEKSNHPSYIGKRVAVVGGGNVAMDAARTIKRLGAMQVTVIYRRSEKEMPAERKEIELAKKEGIHFLFQTNIVQIQGERGKVEKIECIHTKLVKKEGEKREIPVPIENSNETMPMDDVVMAVGSHPDHHVIQALPVEITSKGYIKTKENYQTSHPKIFAGGDVIGTKATVAWAARSGKKAAYAIHQVLQSH